MSFSLLHSSTTLSIIPAINLAGLHDLRRLSFVTDNYESYFSADAEAMGLNRQNSADYSCGEEPGGTQHSYLGKPECSLAGRHPLSLISRTEFVVTRY